MARLMLRTRLAPLLETQLRLNALCHRQFDSSQIFSVSFVFRFLKKLYIFTKVYIILAPLLETQLRPNALCHRQFDSS